MTLNFLRINYLFVTYSGKIVSLFVLRQNRVLRGPRLSFLKPGVGLAPEPMRRILPHLVVDLS